MSNPPAPKRDEMRERLLSRINKIKKKGWRIEPDQDGISLFGIGYFVSPMGCIYDWEVLRFNNGFPDWEPFLKEDIEESRRARMLYYLVRTYCRSCFLDEGIEKLFEES